MNFDPSAVLGKLNSLLSSPTAGVARMLSAKLEMKLSMVFHPVVWRVIMKHKGG